MYTESRKMVLINLFIGKQWRHRHREQAYGLGQRVVRRGWENGESSMEAYTLPYVKKITTGYLLYDSGRSNQGSMTT